MTDWLLWLIILGGPTVAAVVAGFTVHLTERTHWHRLAQTWYDNGYAEGWARSRAQVGTMVPEMVFTPQGTLEPALGDFEPWPEVDAAFAVAMAAVREDFDLARLRVGLH